MFKNYKFQQKKQKQCIEINISKLIYIDETKYLNFKCALIIDM